MPAAWPADVTSGEQLSVVLVAMHSPQKDRLAPRARIAAVSARCDASEDVPMAEPLPERAGMLCVRSFSCWARTHAVSSGLRAVSWRIGTG